MATLIGKFLVNLYFENNWGLGMCRTEWIMKFHVASTCASHACAAYDVPSNLQEIQMPTEKRKLNMDM